MLDKYCTHGLDCTFTCVKDNACRDDAFTIPAIPASSQQHMQHLSSSCNIPAIHASSQRCMRHPIPSLALYYLLHRSLRILCRIFLFNPSNQPLLAVKAQIPSASANNWAFDFKVTPSSGVPFDRC